MPFTLGELAVLREVLKRRERVAKTLGNLALAKKLWNRRASVISCATYRRKQQREGWVNKHLLRLPPSKEELERRREHGRHMERLRYKRDKERDGKTVGLYLRAIFSPFERRIWRCVKARLYKRKEQPRQRAREREIRQREQIRSKKRLYHSRKYRTDIEYHLRVKIRRRIGMSLRRGYLRIMKANSTINLLGCSYTEYRHYIESKFTEGMTWDGLFTGDIHIDHIRPLSSFTLSDPAQQQVAFNFTNTQPMWAIENASKHKYDRPRITRPVVLKSVDLMNPT